MSQKNVLTVLTLISLALGGPVAVSHVTEDTPRTVEIEGVTEAQVGQLIVLTYDGRDVAWDFPTGDHQVLDATRAVVSFRAPGTYVIIAAGKVGSDVQLDQHKILVSGKGPVPESVIDPTPVPVPVPDNSPALTQLVYEWCAEIDADKGVCRAVADNFITAASTTDSVEALVSKTARLNSSIQQGSVAEVLAKAQRYLIQNISGTDFVSHQCAWDEIARGLINWSEA